MGKWCIKKELEKLAYWCTHSREEQFLPIMQLKQMGQLQAKCNLGKYGSFHQ